MRFGLVFLLLVLILLAISALFGLLTYWLDAKIAPTSTPGSDALWAWSSTNREAAKQSWLVPTATGPAVRRRAGC